MEIGQLKNFEFAISIHFKIHRVTFIIVRQFRSTPLIVNIHRLSAVLGIYEAVVSLVSDLPLPPPHIVCGILIAFSCRFISLRMRVLREKCGDRYQTYCEVHLILLIPSE